MVLHASQIFLLFKSASWGKVKWRAKRTYCITVEKYQVRQIPFHKIWFWALLHRQWLCYPVQGWKMGVCCGGEGKKESGKRREGEKPDPRRAACTEDEHRVNWGNKIWEIAMTELLMLISPEGEFICTKFCNLKYRLIWSLSCSIQFTVEQ